MLKKPLFWEMFASFLILGVLNYIAFVYHLYWSTYEFDSLVHFFGGASLSMFFLWLYLFSGFFNPSKINLIQFLIVSIVGAMFVAILWEVYELFLGEVFIQEVEYPYDTMMDLVGALVACFYGYLKKI